MDALVLSKRTICSTLLSTAEENGETQSASPHGGKYKTCSKVYKSIYKGRGPPRKDGGAVGENGHEVCGEV